MAAKNKYDISCSSLSFPPFFHHLEHTHKIHRHMPFRTLYSMYVCTYIANERKFRIKIRAENREVKESLNGFAMFEGR